MIVLQCEITGIIQNYRVAANLTNISIILWWTQCSDFFFNLKNCFLYYWSNGKINFLFFIRDIIRFALKYNFHSPFNTTTTLWCFIGAKANSKAKRRYFISIGQRSFLTLPERITSDTGWASAEYYKILVRAIHFQLMQSEVWKSD